MVGDRQAITNRWWKRWEASVGWSALTLFRNFQPLLDRHFRQSPLHAPRSKQRDFRRTEALLGNPHQLLKLSFLKTLSAREM